MRTFGDIPNLKESKVDGCDNVACDGSANPDEFPGQTPGEPVVGELVPMLACLEVAWG
jgi:hypothetical protein